MRAIVVLGLLVACKSAPEEPAVKLPFSDDFSRADLGPLWFPSGGDWKLRDGYVYSTFANNNPLFLKVDLPDDVVVEVDVYSETDAIDAKLELMTDGLAHQSGYVFIHGGWNNALSVIARLDEHGTDRKQRKSAGVANKWYKWRVEKKGGSLRWLMDGQEYMRFEDAAPLHGKKNNRLAFGNWQNRIRFDNLRIWAHADAPPVRTSTVGG